MPGNKNMFKGILLWILFIALFSIPGILLFIYKQCVITYAKLFHPELKHLTGNDIWVAYDSEPSTGTPMSNFGVLIKLKGSVTIEDLRQKIRTCILDPDNLIKYDSFFSSLVLFGGYLFKAITKTIEIENHVYEMELMTQQKVENFTTNWMLEDYFQSAPNWELVLINLKVTNDAVICFKMHHAFIDAYSLVHILDKITGIQSPYLVKPFTESNTTDLWKMIETPCNIGKMMPVTEKAQFITGPTFGKNEVPKWVYSFITLDLKTIKCIRRKQNVRFSSVLLTLICGALRRYMRDKEYDLDTMADIAAVTSIGWPYHPSRAATPSLANHWTMEGKYLPFHIENSYERLKIINEDYEAYQSLGISKFIKRILMPVLSLFPTIMLKKLLSNPPTLPIGMTNLIGGDDYKIFSKTVSAIQPIAIIPGSNPKASFLCYTFSHSNQIDMTFISHSDILPNKETLDCITNVYLKQELIELCKILDIN